MPYPLAESLVLSYSDPGDLVLDPFVGSGTTASAAVANTRNVIGIDMNPLATLIARVTVAPFDLDSGIAKYNRARLAVLNAIDGATLFPHSVWQTRLSTWFPPKTSTELARVASAIKRTGYAGQIRDYLLLAFSRTVRKCSLARPGELKLWRKETGGPWKHPGDVFSEEAEQLLWSIVSIRSERPGSVRTAKIYTADAESKIDDIGKVDLIVTSPPYGDAWTTVAYGNFALLSRIWLSAIDKSFARTDPATEDERSLGGSRRQRLPYDISELLDESSTLASAYGAISETNPLRAKQVLIFYADIRSVLRKMTAATNIGGHIVIVMGPRRVAGTWLDTGNVFSEFLNTLGVQRIRRDTRRITGKRLPLQTVQGSAGLGDTINQETIDVFVRR